MTTHAYQKISARWEDEWRVLRLRLQAPPGNILDREMIGELRQAAAEARQVAECALVLFEGEGDHFSYGASIPEHRPPEVVQLLAEFHGLLGFLLSLDVPLGALVRGRCLGGGLELVALCDVVFAADDAELGLPEIRLGVFPPAAAALLPHRIGAGRAAKWILSGTSWSAERAQQAGLVSQVLPEAGLQAGFEKWLRATLLEYSSSSLRLATRAARLPWKERFLRDLERTESLYLDELLHHDDAREGIEAFLEKRKPAWSHREPEAP